MSNDVDQISEQLSKEVLAEAREILQRSAALYRKLNGLPSVPEGLAALQPALREAGGIIEAVLRGAPGAHGKTEDRGMKKEDDLTDNGPPAVPSSSSDLRSSVLPLPSASQSAATDAEVVAEMNKLGKGADCDEPDELGLAQALGAVTRVINEEKLVVHRQDYAFVQKAPELVKSAGATEKTARVFIDCVRFMDTIEREYAVKSGTLLAPTLASRRSMLAEYLEAKHETRFVPDPRAGDSASPVALAELVRLRGETLILSPARQPAGEVIGLLKRGVASPRGQEPVQLLVSDGESSDAFELVSRIALRVIRPMNQPPERRQAKAAAYRQIRRKFLQELTATSDPDREETLLRYVINLLQPLNRDGSLDAAIKPVVAELGERGITAIPVRIGVPFDESFGTSKYERKTIRSDEATGQIVAALQMGFVNRQGVPMQKAVVGVSGGPDYH